MYIPFSFLGPGGNNCISASGGDTIGYINIDSELWKYHAFTTTGSHTYNVHSGVAPHKILLVGAGGSGGISVDLDRTGGGGGGGGYLFLDNLPFSSGSFNINVGAGSVSTITPNGSQPAPCFPNSYDYPQSYGGGQTTFEYSFKPTSPDDGYYIPSSTLVAYGGGRGACQWRVCGAAGTSLGSSAGNGASGGGGSLWGDGSATLKSIPSGSALYNLNGLAPHGFAGGPIVGSTVQGGSGGGGSNSVGSAQNTSGTNSGGAGVNLLSYIGFNQTVCSGGPGGEGAGSSWRSPTYQSGSGGAAAKWNDTSQQLLDTRGQNGLAIVLYKVCSDDLSDCTTYTFNGGATGGTITYIECNTGLLTSASIDFGQEGVICTLPITYGHGSNIKTYPSVSGTITLTPTGSCDLNLDIPIVPTCDTGSGEVKTPLYVYNWVTPTACYPTPFSCQRTYSAGCTINYYNQNGPVTFTFAGGFTSNTGTICAREFPQPEITCSVLAGGSGDCSVTKTDIICAYYCSGSI